MILVGLSLCPRNEKKHICVCVVTGDLMKMDSGEDILGDGRIKMDKYEQQVKSVYVFCRLHCDLSASYAYFRMNTVVNQKNYTISTS